MRFLAQHRPLVERLAFEVTRNGVDHLGRTQAQHQIVLGVAGEESGHRMLACGCDGCSVRCMYSVLE